MTSDDRCYAGNNLPTAWACSFFRTTAALVCAGLSLTPLSPVFAQTTPATTQPAKPKAPPCSQPEHRAFDFWIGEWEVTAAGKEKPSAVNRISAEHGGCVIREDYLTKGGYTGMSMSFYDAARNIWHQTWMGKDGGALFVEGGLNEDGAMVLSNANLPGYAAGTPVNRVTWTPNPDGSVRQRWQASQDGGENWTDVFDGLYVKRDVKK